MDKFKKTLRLLGLIILIILACSGLSITGGFLPTNKERYQDNEIRIERIDDKKEDDEEASERKN